MSFLRNYDEKTRYDFDQSKEKIIAKISKGIAKQKSIIDYFMDDIPDLENIKALSENQFEIPFNPTMFNPFKGTGRILISLKDNRDKPGTEIQIEIIPYNEAYVATIYLVFIFLFIWTAFGFLTRTNTNTLIVVALGWIIFPVILYLIPFQNKSKLREYHDVLIEMLKKKSGS